MTAETEKLQKVIARAGLASRRAVETWIAEGRVSVNGRRAEVGARVGPADVVRVDGRRLGAAQTRPDATRVLRYHKPVGEVCTRRDDAGRTTVFAKLPRLGRGRWISVGRLDLNTSGLLLFTNDGELANRLMHPSAGIEREYAVRVRGEVDPAVRRALLDGVTLDDGPARFASVAEAGGSGQNRWYHVIVNEGRNRVVRRLFESQGLEVSRLTRVRFGPVRLPRWLARGKLEPLPAVQTAHLLRAAGLEPPPRDARSTRTRGRAARRAPAGNRPQAGSRARRTKSP